MSKYPLKKIDPPEPTRYAALVMTLSLFIMLLSFFMMMNASANFEDSKVKSVLQSIENTFTSRVFRDGAGPSLRSDDENLLGEGQALESMDAYLRATFPGIEPELIPSRGTLAINLDRTKFEQIMFTGKTSQQKTMIEKMWTFDNLQMEIWLNLQDDPADYSSVDEVALRGQVKATSVWAVALETAGLDKGRLTIGLKKGKADTVTLLFHNYKPYAPMP